MALGSNQPVTEIVPEIFPGGKGGPVRRADNCTAFMCRLSWNLGISTSWKLEGLSRPVQVLLHPFLLYARHKKLSTCTQHKDDNETTQPRWCCGSIVNVCRSLQSRQNTYSWWLMYNMNAINFRYSPCIIIVNHFYYPTNALNYTKLRV